VMQQYPNRIPTNFGSEMEEQSPDGDTESS
jgi:hypothetical protein